MQKGKEDDNGWDRTPWKAYSKKASHQSVGTAEHYPAWN